MWFAKVVPNARCYLVEPRQKNLRVGKANFATNGVKGKFFRSKISHGHLGVDRFMQRQKLPYVDVLHADIQGAEFEMLCDAEESLLNGRIGYVFVGTHSQQLHYQCKSFLGRQGYVTIAHADFDYGTYCCDGVLVARHRDVPGLEPLDIALRDALRQRQAECRTRDLQTDHPAQRRKPPWGTWLRSLARRRGLSTKSPTTSRIAQ